MRGTRRFGCRRPVGGDPGQAIVAVAVVLVVAALAAMAVARLGALMVRDQRAQAAADAAALAAVVGGEPAARRVAAANGATLVLFTVLGQDVLVGVSIGDAGAQARATRAP